VARGRRFLREPGISVVRDAQIALRAGEVHAMHDPTEGGLATGIWEMARASGHGMVVDLERIHVFAETEAFCQVLGLDPLGLIASGALLMAAAPGDAATIVEALQAEGIDAAVVGRVVEGPANVQVEADGDLAPLPIFEQDELGRVFGEPGPV
jgi:hydrogenase maturation factor